jgi:DNA-binding YbaB/EbfC family protein
MTTNSTDFLQYLQGMQQKMAEMQERIGTVEATGSAGGGMIEVDITGKMEITAVRITKDALICGEDGVPDLEMLGDLVVSACRSAHDKAEQAVKSQISGIAQGFSIPGLAGLFPGL